MISIIIPTQNRADLLEITLNSLVNLNYDFSSYEILVIDNASSDNTKLISENIINQNPDKNIRYIFEPIAGLQSGRQKGAIEAKGEILVFIDDDIEIDPNWLQAINDTFQDENIHLVGGPSYPKYEIEPPFWIDFLWNTNNEKQECGYYSLLYLGENQKEIDPNYVWGLNFSIRKKTFFDLGGFHPDCIPKKVQRFQGDGETGLTMKLKEKGLKAIYNPKVVVNHWVTKERMTFEYLEKRMYYQGVCDSFTKIRTQHFNNTPNTSKSKETSDYQVLNQSEQTSILSRIKNRLLARDLKNEIKKLKTDINILNNEIFNLKTLALKTDTQKELETRMKIAYQRGFEFHQNEVANDPKLLEWVLKPDYFDYDYTKYL